MIYKCNENVKLTPKRIIFISISIMVICSIEIIKFIFSNINLSFRGHISIVFLIAVLSYFFVLVGAYYCNKRIDVFMIFIILSFPFLFGGHLLTIFNMMPNGQSPFRKEISVDVLVNTSYLCCEAVICLFIGYLFIEKKACSINFFKHNSRQWDYRENKNMYNIGACVVLISFIPFLKEGISAINTTLRYGYGYRIIEGANATTTLSTILSGFFIYGVFAMYLTKKKKDILPNLLLLFFFCIYTLEGSRISTFCYLTLFFYLYYVRSDKKIKICKVFPVIMLVIIVFPLISSARGMVSTNSFSEAIKMGFESIWNNNIISSVLSEASRTFNATAIVLEHCPSSHPHVYGISYLAAFIYIIPNKLTGNILNNFNFADDTFAPYLTAYGGIGSSFVAEAYYNFGNILGLLFLIILGIFWGILSKKIEINLLKGNVIGIFWYCQIYISVVFMIRSELLYRLRPLFWYGLPVVVITYILNLRSRKYE